MESTNRITAYPARAELALRRITFRRVAQAARVSAQTVGRGVNGMQPPDPRVIAACVQLTGVAPELLFPSDAPVLHLAVKELVRRSAEYMRPTGAHRGPLHPPGAEQRQGSPGEGAK